jgi:hypothetical protein
MKKFVNSNGPSQGEVDRGPERLADRTIHGVADDSDDGLRAERIIADRRHAECEGEGLVDWALIRKKPPHERLVDYHHRPRRQGVVVVEVAANADRHAIGREPSGRDSIGLRDAFGVR